MSDLVRILLIYVLIMSIISIIVTMYDKIAATKRPEGRIRERTLLLLSALGGSVAMYIAMQLIRHKTLHKKFMIGIPAIIVLQFALVCILVKFGVIK